MSYASGRMIHDADSHLMELDDCLEPYFDPRLLTRFKRSEAFAKRVEIRNRPGRSREAHAEPYGRPRNHSRRHVSDRLSQLLGEETFNRRLCRGKESAALAAIIGYKTLKQCRVALSEAGLQKLYPNLAYLRTLDGHPTPAITAAEFKALVSRTLQLVTVSAQYRRSNGWTKTTDRSFYGSYAILALPEIFNSARAADIATFITQHEPRPPPVSVDELRAAVAAAER